ncbi:hypothetical protein BN9982_280017 [Mycobacterium tuberculosis]|nr:hypothetical protein BN9982_280017 [Mycobacterium tuberculosis]
MFGWKVLLPLVTGVSSLCLATSPSGHSLPSNSIGPRDSRRWFSLLAGAVPGLIQVAAASPTFGRLFEGTYAPSPGQTSPTRQPLQGILPAKLLTIRTPETATLTKNPPQRKTTVGSRTENC